MEKKRLLEEGRNALLRPVVRHRIRMEAELLPKRGTAPVMAASLKSNREYPLFILIVTVLAVIVVVRIVCKFKTVCQAFMKK